MQNIECLRCWAEGLPLRAVGEYPKSLIDTWNKIWQSNLNRTYTGDFELYGEQFHIGSPKAIDIYIAVSS